MFQVRRLPSRDYRKVAILKPSSQPICAAQVQALTLQNEYQMRLKDLNMNERIKELTKKYTSEAEEARARHVLLAQEKTETEAEYEEKLRALEERAAQQAAAVENQYQQKLMGEVERYQQLAQVRSSGFRGFEVGFSEYYSGFCALI